MFPDHVGLPGVLSLASIFHYFFIYYKLRSGPHSRNVCHSAIIHCLQFSSIFHYNIMNLTNFEPGEDKENVNTQNVQMPPTKKKIEKKSVSKRYKNAKTV